MQAWGRWAFLLNAAVLVSASSTSPPTTTAAPTLNNNDGSSTSTLLVILALVIGGSCLLLCCCALVAAGIYEYLYGGLLGLKGDRAYSLGIGEDFAKTFNNALLRNVSVLNEQVSDAPNGARDAVRVINVERLPGPPDPSGSRTAILQSTADGQRVIYTLNPRLVSAASGLSTLAESYLAIFREAFRMVSNSTGLKAAQLPLRIAPLGSSYAGENAISIQELSLSSLAVAFHRLAPNELEAAKSLRLQLCVAGCDGDAEDDDSDEEQARGWMRENQQPLNCHSRASSSSSKRYTAALNLWKKTAGKSPVGSGQLPRRGNFDWIMNSKADADRFYRLGAFCTTRSAVDAGAYGGGAVARARGSLQRVCSCCCPPDMEGGAGIINSAGLVAGTQVLSASRLPPLSRSPQRTPRLKSVKCDTLSAAEIELGRNVTVCAVSAAAGYQAGGGFTTGGRHALEEAMCTQSTLYSSLETVLESSASRGQNQVPYFPPDSAILSPGVTIFREGSKLGYIFKQQPFQVNIVSIAMPNKNPAVKDSPLDAPKGAVAYQQLVAAKMRAMLHAAALSQSDVLVVPDVGCGVFNNDAAEVGTILGKELANYSGYFARIVLCGKPAFKDAVVASLSKASTQTGMTAVLPVDEVEEVESEEEDYSADEGWSDDEESRPLDLDRTAEALHGTPPAQAPR